jgi:hypothetical protein
MAEDELFCNWEGAFVNGLVEDGDSLVKCWDCSAPTVGVTFSLVARAAHSASNGSSKTTALTLLHRLVAVISIVGATLVLLF